LVTFGTHDIFDHDGQVWRLAANRTVAPSRWLLTDPTQRLVLQFDQQALRKLINPFRRTGLVLRDASDNELFRLVDPRTGLLDRIFGSGVNDWVLMEKDRPAAMLVRLPKEQSKPKGLLDRLSRLLPSWDDGLASAGPTHVLRAPAALVLLMLVRELTDSSGEVSHAGRLQPFID